MTVARAKRTLHLESQSERRSSMKILIAVTGILLGAVLLGAVLSNQLEAYQAGTDRMLARTP